MSGYGYGVKLVRGPFVKLPPDPHHVDGLDALLDQRGGLTRPLAVDLFCGAGGLSLGLQDAGFNVVVGVDNDRDALETHAHLFGGATLNLDLGDAAAVDDLARRLARLKPDLVAGGPPCQPFSRAGMSKIRSLVESGERHAVDHRRDLWQAFLHVVLRVHPPAVLLENVPDMALSGRMEIIRTVVDELERADYTVHTRLLHAWEHGVPQHRQRLFVVAVEGDRGFRWPNRSSPMVTVDEALSDLPEVEGGARPPAGADGWWDWSAPATLSPFARRARRGLTRHERRRVRDHITRPVRPDDRRAFELMGPRTLYADLPDHLKRYRDDIFDDKYKRLDPDEPSRSITAHIARDGYWYIHPTQPRTLTVREAARLQTFPDRVRFAGPPSSAFRQIGNAVPPRLGEAVGRRLLRTGVTARARTSHPQSIDTGAALSDWVASLESLTIPWALPPSSWTVVLASTLLSRRPPTSACENWDLLAKLEDPATTVENANELIEVAAAVGRTAKARSLLRAAKWLLDTGWDPADDDEFALARAPGISRELATLAVGLAPGAGPGPVPVTSPLLRLVGRLTGRSVADERSRSDGRLEIARLIGGTTLQSKSHDARRALGGAVELAARLCRPAAPACGDCPLVCSCRYAAKR